MTNRAIRVAFAMAALLAVTLAGAQGTGSANFGKFVAIGDSLTAGFTNGGVGVYGQTTSLPFLIYRQVNGSGSGFEQPWISDPGIPAQLELQGLFPTVLAPKPGTGQPLNLGLTRPYDNMAVPGADVNDVIATLTDGGGLFDLVLRGQGTMLQQALALQPTFMSVWVGNNDALGAATSGTPALLTPLQQFDDDYTSMMDQLIAAGVQMVVANIPDVTAIPFVSTIPSVLVDPTTNEVVINPATGQPVPLIGPSATPLTPADRVLLSASSVLALGCGIPFPIGLAGGPGPFPAQCPNGLLPDTVVLDAAEVAQIQSAIAGYNAVIAREAGRAGAAFVDAFSILNRIASEGTVVGGIEFGSDFLTGGLFGYDGVHPSLMGYAVVANEFIQAINRTYGAQIRLVSLRPFVFGEIGGAAQLPVSMATGASISAEGLRNLRAGLGLESLGWVAPDPSEPPNPDAARPRARSPRFERRPTGLLRERSARPRR